MPLILHDDTAGYVLPAACMSICGTGSRPPLAASCVPSTWCVAAYGHVQEQHVPTRQEKRALLPLHDKSAGKARTFPINTPPSVRADVTDELMRNGP